MPARATLASYFSDRLDPKPPRSAMRSGPVQASLFPADFFDVNFYKSFRRFASLLYSNNNTRHAPQIQASQGFIRALIRDQALRTTRTLH